jgi:hypothetical protein
MAAQRVMNPTQHRHTDRVEMSLALELYPGPGLQALSQLEVEILLAYIEMEGSIHCWSSP